MNAPAELAKASLEDKYTVESGRVFLTGMQALIRLMMLQRERDLRAGLNTAGFVSGYRGSPLGGLDQALWRAQKHLESHHIKFQPGVNEDLAATAVWGTQQVGMFPGANYDGVYSMWYGKGPGVDRCGDVFKHANAAGTSKHGGVLALAGDDHAAKSSTLPHQSEHIFKACLIPVLNPSNVQDYLDLGLHGFAMSRYSGCWIAFKCVTDVVESGASVVVDPQRITTKIPADFALPGGGLNIRWPDGILEQEARILDYKVYAALAYCRANGLDRIVWDSPRARFGICTTGKSYGDVMEALSSLGIDERSCARHRPSRLQGRDVLAARAAGRAALRRGPGRDPGGRGEAPADRVPDQGRALQLEGRRARAARGRQVRRQRRVEPQRRPARRHLAAARALRALARRWSREPLRNGFRSWV